MSALYDGPLCARPPCNPDAHCVWTAEYHGGNVVSNQALPVAAEVFWKLCVRFATAIKNIFQNVFNFSNDVIKNI